MRVHKEQREEERAKRSETQHKYKQKGQMMTGDDELTIDLLVDKIKLNKILGFVPSAIIITASSCELFDN
jgi:hypothetical protein